MNARRSVANISLKIAAASLLLNIANATASQPSAMELLLRRDLDNQRSADFGPLLGAWERRWAETAVPALVQLAADPSLSETLRAIALAGAERLGHRVIAPALVPFLTDASWLLRSTALQALKRLGDPSVGPSILPLLRDPALVVRREAVEAVAALNPPGATRALVDTVFSEANYYNDTAHWVAHAALRALVTLNASEAARELRPLLLHFDDPSLQRETITALATLTGHQLPDPRLPLNAQALEWEKYLRRL